SINDQPYNNIGEQDITTHVNFSALIDQGIKHGLQFTGFSNQLQFLQSLGLSKYIRPLELAVLDKPGNAAKLMFIHSFLLEMGKRIKVLIQHKGIPKPYLSGLAFSQSF